jgi:sorting nexin-1/2
MGSVYLFLQICFQQRVHAFKHWQSAESTLQKKRENEAKVKAVNKTEKIPQAEQEVKEAEAGVVAAKKEFDELSMRIKVELDRFHLVQIHDLQEVVIAYVEAVMTLEHQMVKAWEAFLPEAKAINVKA